MPDTTPISSHGTILSFQKTPGGAFSQLSELGDITPPEFSRNEFDATTQTRNIDKYVLGVLRRGALQVSVNYLPGDDTHDALTGVYKLIKDNIITGWKLEFPDGTEWVASGQVQKITPKAPVDGKLAADITIRLSDVMMIDDEVIGD